MANFLVEAKLTLDNKKFQAGAKQASQALDGMNNKGKKTSHAMQNMAESTRQASSSAKQLAREQSQAVTIMNNLKMAVAAYVSAQGALSVLRIADEYTLLNARLGIVTSSAEELAFVQRELTKTALETGTALSANLDVYQRIARGREALNASTGELLSFTKSLQKLTVISGLTTAEATNSIVQLSQGLASGTLRGDELRSVMEQMEPLVKVITDHLQATNKEFQDLTKNGDSSLSAFRKLAEQGKITGRVILGAVGGATDEIQQKMDKIPLTMGRALENFRTQFTLAVGGFDASTGVTANLAAGINMLANNLDIVAYGLGALSAIMIGKFAGRAVGAMTASVAVAATNMLSLNAATTNVSRSMMLATTSATALRGALAFLGGPAGVLLTVASAFSMYALTLSDSTDKAGSMVQSLRLLRGEAGVTAKETIQNAKNMVSELQKELAKLEASQTSFNPFNYSYQRRQKEINSLKTQIESLNAEINKTQNAKISLVPPTQKKELNELEKELGKLAQATDSLNWQWVAFEQSGEKGVKRARHEMRLLALAQERGIEISQQTRDEIAKTVDTYYRASEALSQAKDTAKKHSEAIKTINQAYLQTQDSQTQAIASANQWRQATLHNLDRTSKAYDAYASKVEDIYQNRITQAQQQQLEQSTYWADGAKRAFNTVAEESSNMANLVEGGVKKAFTSLEDSLVGFASGTQTASQAFSNFAKSIIDDMLRISIRSAVMGGMANIFGSAFGGASAYAPSNFTGMAYANGGLIKGEGTGTSDSILARVSNGEYIVKASATKRFLPLLEQINNTPKFANGGLVGGSSHNSTSAVTPNITISIDAKGAEAGVESRIRAAIASALPEIVSATKNMTINTLMRDARQGGGLTKGLRA